MKQNAKAQHKRTGESPLDAALRFLGPRARTIREVERHLDDLDYGEIEIMETVERLKELSLLGDEAYASEFIDSRLRSKPVSRAHLKEQLRSHEIDADIIDDALSVVDDDLEKENAYRAAKACFPKEGMSDDGKTYERLIAKLMRHGFGYYDSRSAIDRCVAEAEGTER